jgi:hypothetical protein
MYQQTLEPHGSPQADGRERRCAAVAAGTANPLQIGRQRQEVAELPAVAGLQDLLVAAGSITDE